MWKSVHDRHCRTHFNINTWPGRKKGDPRSIYFGAHGDRLVVYERGILHSKDESFAYPLTYTRLEAQISGTKAREVFSRIVAGEEIKALAAGLIAGYVTFLDPKDSDKNQSRRRVDPFWEKYLDGVERLKIDVPKTEPDISRQMETFRKAVKNRLIEHDPARIVKAFLTELADHLKTSFSDIEAQLLTQLKPITF
jgi:hypothetical protein